MSDGDFLQQLPELILLVRRDGTLLRVEGGRGVPALRALGSWDEGTFHPAWPEPVAVLIAQLARRAIADRGRSTAHFDISGEPFEIRAAALGQDRCACTIIPAAAAAQVTDRRAGDRAVPSREPDRRGFLRRLTEALSRARLREHPLAVAVIQIDDITEL